MTSILPYGLVDQVSEIIYAYNKQSALVLDTTNHILIAKQVCTSQQIISFVI